MERIFEILFLAFTVFLFACNTDETNTPTPDDESRAEKCHFSKG